MVFNHLRVVNFLILLMIYLVDAKTSLHIFILECISLIFVIEIFYSLDKASG